MDLVTAFLPRVRLLSCLRVGTLLPQVRLLAHPEIHEGLLMAMAGLRLLPLLHGVLNIKCCPFPLCTVTVNLLAPRIVAGYLSRVGGESAQERLALGRAKSQVPQSLVSFLRDDKSVPLGKRGQRQR